MRKIQVILLALFLTLVKMVCAQPYPASEQKIEDFISKMTLDEKIDFIGGYEEFNIRPIERLGIPMVRMADGPVGMRNYGPSTAYPASVLLAATWDTAMASRVGNAIGKEARAKNVHIMLGPGMNIYRAPMCGRNFEYLGEDPFLAGKMASSYIKGMQSEGVMATAKHFAANYMEYDRHNGSSDIDERTLQEIYLPAFRACVQEGQVACVMNSYNLLNGVHTSQSDYLLTTILKNDWGFKGFVMSDWGSTYDGVAAANAGLDIEMPNAKFMNKDTLIPAIQSGKVSEKIIDDKIRRILREYQRFGLFEQADISTNYKLDSASVRKTAIDAARGGIVLLKNTDNLLPLNTNKIKTVAIIGPNADPAVTGGGGSSYVQPMHPLSFVQAFKKVAGEKIKVNYTPGVYGRDPMPDWFYNQSEFYYSDEGEKVPGMKAEFFSNRRPDTKPDYVSALRKINKTFTDSIPGVNMQRFAVRLTGLLKVDQSGKYRFVVSSTAGYRLKIDDKEVLGAWRNEGEQVRSALVQLIEGTEHKIELIYFQRNAGGLIRLGYEAPVTYQRGLADAMVRVSNAVKQSDLAIVCVGFNSETEHEGADRTFELPESQEFLIKTALETGKDIVVVVNAGGNIDMQKWIANTKALLYVWYPGQEGNLALAEIITGITNPSGKLPVSFEKKWADNASYTSYFDSDSNKQVSFTEGIFTGYRHFDKENIEPQFPFGFGLSYTNFIFGDLTLAKEQFDIGEPVEVSIRLTNSGPRDGAEVIQLYVGDTESTLPRPVKELKAFSKVWLKAGESKIVTFTLNRSAFQYYNPGNKGWVLESGEFTIQLGNSSANILLSKKITIK